MSEQLAEFSALNPALVEAFTQYGFSQLTEVQQAVLPLALKNHDVLAQAPTGSGKTLAFVMPGLNALEPSILAPQILVLCPTRELAEQVASEYRRMAIRIPHIRVIECTGGVPVSQHRKALDQGAHIVVGTPGRIADLTQRKILSLENLRTRVFDEADRMLEMGFAEDLERIFAPLRHSVQTLLFSATMPPEVEDLANGLMTKPERFVAEQIVVQSIEQVAYRCEAGQRTYALKALLTEQQPERAIVFCNMRKDVAEVAQALKDDGFAAVALHGELTQPERNQALFQFSSGCGLIMVATDVAARGIDISQVDCVINYQLSDDQPTHVHRVGRTGRAGKSGKAFTLIEANEEGRLLLWADQLAMKIAVKGPQGLRFHKNRIVPASLICIGLSAGKKDKLRPGDFVGALVQDAQIDAKDIGDIKIQAKQSFLAIKERSVKRALKLFREGKVKGKRVRATRLYL